MTETILIHTKIKTPRVGDSLVKRPYLLQQLDKGLNSKLVLVSAPAGFGKTTLVVDWLNQVERPFAWYALDEDDNDLSLFLSYFLGAIRSVFPEACTNFFQLLQALEHPSSNQIAVTLINDLLDLPEPIILVLDDYHLIYDRTIHELLNLLLQSMPDTLQLIICSRTDPFLLLPRLRGKGQLLEIRANELRFTHLEAQQFFAVNSRHQIDDTLAIQINERVEGWPVGLRLAYLSLSHVEEQHAWLDNVQTHSNQFFTEYLFTEVLSQQTEAVQQFLLTTAILDRFCNDIYCALHENEMMDWAQSQAILEEIKAANLFLIPLDEADGWYRYHHLFQNMLRQALLAQIGQQQVNQLHQQAAKWFANNGFLAEALKHALAAHDMETAVAIVEDNSRNFLNGLERHTLERWMDSLPEKII